MNEPRRLRDDPEAGAPLRGLLKSAGVSRPMSREVRARSQARIDRLAVVPAAAGLLFWLKGVAIAASALAVAGVSVAVVVQATARHTQTGAPATASASVGRPISQAPPVPPPPPVALHDESVPMPAPPPHVAVAPRESLATVDLLAKEASMLEQARSELGHDPASALATLEAHAREFPGGALAPERELLAIDALGRLGRTREARLRGEALLERSRGSLYEERVRALLGGLRE
jgi:hypothetical protein